MSFVFYLVGPPGSGKRTVGKALSRLTGAALLDNHLSNDPIFTAFGVDGKNELPPEVWELVGQVRTAMLQAVRLAPAKVSHIFTNYLASDEGEWQGVEGLRLLAAERGAQFVPVWLTCPLPELERRMGLPERAERRKLRDPAKLREVLDEYGILPAPPEALDIDTSQVSPDEAAAQIVAFAKAGQDRE